MITRISHRLRRLRRALSRSEWLARILPLSRGRGDRATPGLLLIQVDGLSRPELDDAIASGRMPFLRRLLQREGYALHSVFSGLPSATPAAQAELFYGVERSVPAFSYRDRKSGRVRPLYDRDAAADLERRLRRLGRGLLEGGSSWANVLGGGAAEPHVSASTTGLHEAWRAANPLTLMLALIIHAPAVVRIAVLSVVELALAITDFVRGLFGGHDIAAELKFVPSRVAISVILRELAVIGASVDLARGLPVVQLNLIGYDEQSHRRGPHSAFARWTQRGIDRAIARLFASAARAERRLYETWIHSDHGQETARQFERVTGRSLRAVVEEALGIEARDDDETNDGRPANGASVASRRARWLAPRRHAPEAGSKGRGLQIADMGPIALIYPEHPLGEAERASAARALVAAGVPLVLAAREDAGGDESTADAWTRLGHHELPRDAALVLGENHPFLETTARELALLCRHPEAGELMLSGWIPDDVPLTFPAEGGAHGGPGREEVHAFCLLPEDAPIVVPDDRPLRHGDLRRAAFEHLDRPLEGRGAIATRPSDVATAAGSLRIVTYNVHSCVGMDGVLSPDRVAHALARLRPDVVCLQELDVNRPRSGGIDQAHRIARHLSMDHHFHATVHVEEERYGNAVLSTMPFRVMRAEALPGLEGVPRLEPRGALWVRVEPPGAEALDVIVTHLGLSARARRVQAEALMGPRWLGDARCSSRVVLCGDFNALPGSATCRTIGSRMRDAQLAAEHHVPQGTFFARRPIGRIDHVFVSQGLEVVAARVPRTPATRVASDHLPLVVDLAIGRPGGS